MVIFMLFLSSGVAILVRLFTRPTVVLLFLYVGIIVRCGCHLAEV